MSKRIKEYRDELTSENIKEIITSYGIEPVSENPAWIVYPTVCHNREHHHASHKLYYYKKDKIFKCYTECDEVFDIFQLIIKMDRLRGKETSLPKSLKIAGINSTEPINEEEYYSIKKQLNYLHSMNDKDEMEPAKIVKYSKEIMDRYVFDLEYLKPWINEGIAPSTLTKYNIKFDTTKNAIIIPYYTTEKELVGVRGRFLNPDAKAKYMPIKYNGTYLSHPTSRILYGLDINKEAITKTGMVILWEGEKSCMKMDTIYGANNISVAVSGKNISEFHIEQLIKLGAKEVVIAFDREYNSIKEIREILKEYRKITKNMRHFFNISIIVDNDFVLPYKEAPIDKGKEVFEKLMSERVYI